MIGTASSGFTVAAASEPLTETPSLIPSSALEPHHLRDGRDLGVAVRFEELAKGGHRHLVPAAYVDAAQEDEVSGHRARRMSCRRSAYRGGR